jgi:hypothetical protein
LLCNGGWVKRRGGLFVSLVPLPNDIPVGPENVVAVLSWSYFEFGWWAVNLLVLPGVIPVDVLMISSLLDEFVNHAVCEWYLGILMVLYLIYCIDYFSCDPFLECSVSTNFLYCGRLLIFLIALTSIDLWTFGLRPKGDPRQRICLSSL